MVCNRDEIEQDKLAPLRERTHGLRRELGACEPKPTQLSRIKNTTALGHVLYSGGEDEIEQGKLAPLRERTHGLRQRLGARELGLVPRKKKVYQDDTLSFLAERMRFELTVHIAAHTRFPSVRLQPLGHLSVFPYCRQKHAAGQVL